ncbi:hypothetical protein EDB19DRAFT_1677562 [Suillus lakei]|nr:hypothetical protein EDB19DRAFT_1677562 [Suillus lakei]
MLIAAPFERSSEAVVCDTLLVNPGAASLMRGIYKMMEPGTAVARCVTTFPMAALHWSWTIIKEATSMLDYCLRTGAASLAQISVACLSKIAHMLSSATHYITMFVVTARRWPLFILHQSYAFLAACLCWILIGIKAIHHFVQREPAKKTQIPIITITPAKNDGPSAHESVDIAVLLEEIREGTTGLEPLLGDTSLSSDDCPEDGVVDEPRIDEPLCHVSCGHVGGEEELLVAKQHTLLGGQGVHTECPDYEIRLDVLDEALPGAITGEPEIHAICSRDSRDSMAVKIEGSAAYSPLVPSREDGAMVTASIHCKAGYPILRLAPKERAPGEQPTFSEGGAYQKTIPGSAKLEALKQEGIYNNQDVLNPCVMVDVPEPKGPSHCPGTTPSVDESCSDPAVESIEPHRAVFPLPDSVQATVKIQCTLAPRPSTASEPSLIIQGDNERRLNTSTILSQENSDQHEDNSLNKIYLAPGNETFIPEAAMETKESAFIPFVPPSSVPRNTYPIKKEGSLLTTMPEASIPGEFPSAQLSAHNARPSTSPNTKGCLPSVKEGPTKIASDGELYSISNSILEGQKSTSEIWDFPKSGTNAPFHRFLSASIHAPSGQSSEPNHCIGGAIESSPAMPQSGRSPHVVLNKNSLNHRAASFMPQGLVLKSTLTRYAPPLRLAGPDPEQGDHALNVNLSNPTHSRKYMADQPDHIARAYGPQPLHSAGANATHRNVPPRMAVSGANYITTHRAPSTCGPVPDWAAEAAAKRRSVDMHISAPKVYLGISTTRASSLHQSAGTTTLRTPIPEDMFSPAPQRVASKVARWAAEVNRVREPATSQILEGSSLDMQVKGCRQGAQQRPLLLNRKANTTLSRDDTPAVFPSTFGAAYHCQGSKPSEFAKRAVETRDKEQTKYGDLLLKTFDEVLMRILGLSRGSTTLTTNPCVQGTSNGQSPATVSDLSLSEWFNRGRDPISGDDIERMIRMLERGS